MSKLRFENYKTCNSKGDIMKYPLLLLALFITQTSQNAYTGQLLNRIQDNNRVDYTPIRFYSKTAPYTQGGTIFTFPENYFTTLPHIQVSLQLNKATYNAQLQFHTFITDLSTQMATINVNKVNTGIIHDYTTEANTDEVIVHLFAFGY